MLNSHLTHAANELEENQRRSIFELPHQMLNICRKRLLSVFLLELHMQNHNSSTTHKDVLYSIACACWVIVGLFPTSDSVLHFFDVTLLTEYDANIVKMNQKTNQKLICKHDYFNPLCRTSLWPQYNTPEVRHKGLMVKIIQRLNYT